MGTRLISFVATGNIFLGGEPRWSEDFRPKTPTTGPSRTFTTPRDSGTSSNSCTFAALEIVKIREGGKTVPAMNQVLLRAWRPVAKGDADYFFSDRVN